MTPADNQAERPIRIVIVEDDMVFRSGLRSVLSFHTHQVQIIAEVSSKNEAIRVVPEKDPELVLLDLRIPEKHGVNARPSSIHGIAAIKEITQLLPATKILVLTYMDDYDVIFQAIRAGAHGYIIKGEAYDGAVLSNAICQVVAGEVHWSAQIVQRIRDYHSQNGDMSGPVEPLTSREREVLDLLAERKSNADIAKELVIGISTVRTHVANILAKLHLSSRHEVPTYVKLREQARGET